MKKLIVLADWASDSLTYQEARSAIEGHLKDPTGVNITFVESTPSTVHTAYLKAQIVETEERYGRPHETVIYQNTDPRIQTKEAVEAAKGADFIVVRLASGMFICGPNAGYNYSLLGDKIEKVYIFRGLDKGSQFRSRDLFPKVGAYLMDGMEDELDLEEVPNNIIPALDGYYAAHIDNYGNIKTSITAEDFKGKYEFGDTVKVKLNGVEKDAEYVTNLFGGGVGKLVVYPGSSGKKDNPFLEVSVWTHFDTAERQTGAYHFNSPRPGQKIEVK